MRPEQWSVPAPAILNFFSGLPKPPSIEKSVQIVAEAERVYRNITENAYIKPE